MAKDIAALSRRIAPLQEKLADRGFDEILLGGSASIGVLDLVWEGKPLALRDIDVYLVWGKQVAEDDAKDLARYLEGPEVGALDCAGVTTHVRANPRAPGPEKYRYLAGWGMNFVREGSILDLTVYHSQSEIPLNGIFSSDTVKLRLAGVTLEELVEREIRKHSLEELIRRKIVRDEAGGYEDWRKREPRLIRWIEVERDPAVQAIRVARGLLRYGLTQVPDAIAEPFRRLAAERRPYDETRWRSGLARMAADGQTSLGHALLRQLGFDWLLEK